MECFAYLSLSYMPMASFHNACCDGATNIEAVNNLSTSTYLCTCDMAEKINKTKLNLCCAEFIWGNIKNILAFTIISQHWDGAGSWNPSSWKTRIFYPAYSIPLLLIFWQHKGQGISSHGIALIVLEHSSFSTSRIKTLRSTPNWQHFADDIFKCIFFNENVWILLKISLKFVPKGPINNIPALVQIMAWCSPGDKPLSEPRMINLPMHIGVSRPQWIKGMISI